MFIGDLFEDGSSRRIVVTYPGRFQPFHLGHAEVFRSLQSKFGADNVFIVTSNKVDGEKSPFNFSDKVRFMHAAGIPDHSIIEASQVYKLPDQFDGQKENLIFVVAVGEPDKQRLNPGTITKKTGGPSYFQNLPEDLDQAEMSDRHGYVVVASERQKTVSIGGKQYDVSHGTEVRKLWNHIRNSPEQRQAFMKQLYGRSDPDLANILDKIPQSMAEEGGVGVVKAGDKRYSNALTVDVKPNTLGKEMKAYGLVGRKSPSTQQQKVGKDVGKGVYDGVAEGRENFNGIDISMEIQKDDEYVDDEDYDNQVLYVTASSKGKELGHVLFAFDGEYLMPQDLEVEERYRGQGIAQIMYDYVKSKGYKIRRSGQQTDAGAGFWDKHKPGKNIWEQGVAEDSDNNRVSFKVQKGKNKFATTLSIGGNPVGVYQYDANTGRSIAEVYPEFKGKGLGKLLVLHAIYTAAKLGLDFQEDESRTSEYDNVLDSLSSSGYIVDDDGYWYVTGEGEQFLKQSLKQGVAENFADGRNPGRKGLAKRSGVNTKASVSSLRKTARHSTGEKARMAHWLANMKAGRAKKK